jgi:hypothetical protein
MIMIALYVCNSTQISLSFGMGGVLRLCISGFMRTCVFHMERMNQNITTFCCRASYEHLLSPGVQVIIWTLTVSYLIGYH